MTSEQAAPAELPQQDRDRGPDDQGDDKSKGRIMAGQHQPKDESEACEADAAECGSGGVDACGHTAADGAVVTDLELPLLLVRFDEGGRGGKDRREGEKETARPGTEMLGDKAGDYRGDSAKDESHDVFVRSSGFQRR